MKIYESESIIVTFDKEIPTIVWHAKEPATSKDFRDSNEASLDKFIELKKEHSNLNSRLLDVRNFGALSPDDMEWASKVADPKFLAAGVLYHAMIIPEDIFGQLTVDEYLSQSEGGSITNRMFSSLEEAKEWLISVSK